MASKTNALSVSCQQCVPTGLKLFMPFCLVIPLSDSNYYKVIHHNIIYHSKTTNIRGVGKTREFLFTLLVEIQAAIGITLKMFVIHAIIFVSSFSVPRPRVISLIYFYIILNIMFIRLQKVCSYLIAVH